MPSRPHNSLFRVKSISSILAETEHAAHLKRTLGPISLTALGIGAIIGSGIFVLTGVASAQFAGPALIISFIIAGIASALAALCYAEFAGCLPISGSAYTYSYATLGELAAWMIGWILLINYALGAIAVSIGWSAYFRDFLRGTFGLLLPTSLTSNPFSGGIIDLPAVLIVLLLTLLLISGTSESTLVNNIMVIIKIMVILLFLLIGIGHVNRANWNPFLPFGLVGVFQGASIIFFAYNGFDQVSTAAEEARNPSRDLPISIILSLITCTLLYIIMTAVLTGIISYTRLNVESPVSFALISLGLNTFASIISFGAICALTTVLLALLYSQSRIFYAMGRDGLLPSFFTHIHPRFQTPHLATLTIGLLVAALAGFTPIVAIAELSNAGALSTYLVVSLAVIILRRTRPTLSRTFRVPFVPLIPILSILTCLFLLFNLSLATLLRFALWLILGLLIYFLYSRHTSHLQKSPHTTPPHP